MHYLAIAIVVFAVALAVALAGCRGETASGRPFAPPIATVATAPLTRADMAKRLQALAASPTPKELAPGAMCYKMASPPDRCEYVCPTCGEKTLHVLTKGGSFFPSVTWLLEHELPACRRLVKDVRGLALRLDESEFCKKCQPDAKDPKLVLVVRFTDDAQEVRTRDIGEDDLRLLQEFLAGDAKHKGAADRETPLKEHLPRLRELLSATPERGKRKR